MKDIGTTPETDDPAADVVRRLTHRLQADADLAYLIAPGTETYDHLLRAVQKVFGCTEAEAKRATRCAYRTKPRLVSLRERVDHLEALLDERSPGWRDEDGES